jgi:NADH-quinone oxidoreductase subunit L
MSSMPNLNLWLIPLLPLTGAAINGLFGRRFSNKLVNAVALFFTAASFAWALVCVMQFWTAGANPITETHGAWLHLGDFVVEYGFLLDRLSMVMLLVVTGVGFLIHVYATGYMAHEGGYYRFFCYLNLFMFFMLTLVLANNYLLMFVGWEGVGLASYLLIGFYFLRDSAANAGKKAFITNRVGDFGFLIALFLLVKHFGTLQYDGVFARASAMPVEVGAGLLTAIALLMFVGATGKSAQIPLYVWLPDAMEGPTPVSALIHAATMVTAGVYMVCRSNAIFSRAPIALMVVAIIGALTAFFAATIGITQTDIKRVLAYSTVSQLGYMMMAAGVAAYSAAIFHLMTHAFFKALLFLAAGSVIHGVGGEQDMRKMGGLKKYMPWTFGVMFIATLAIAGIPGFAGFFSKDEILWQAYSSQHGHWALWLVGLITALMTSFYMFRLIFMTFYGEYRGATAEAHVGSAPHTSPAHGQVADKEHAGHAHAVPISKPDSQPTPAHGGHDDHGHHGEPHESPWIMLAPLVLLAVLSVVGGWIGVPKALGGSNHFHHFLAPVVPVVPSESAHATVGNEPSAIAEKSTAEPVEETESPEDIRRERLLTGDSTFAAFGGLFLAWFLYVKRPELPARIAASAGGLYTTVLNKYYVDEIYGAAIIRPLIAFSRTVLWKGIDSGTIDRSIDGAAQGSQEISDGVRTLFSGNIRSYAGWVSAGAAVVVIYMVWVAAR